MFLPHMVWKHLPQNRWFNQHLMYSFTSLTVIKKKKKVTLWISHVEPGFEAEGQLTTQRSPWHIKDSELKARVVSWKSSQLRVALCVEYAGDTTWNRWLTEYLNSGFATPQSGKKFWPWKVNFKSAYRKFCDFTMELSMVHPQWKCGIPVTGSSWDKWD